MDQTPETNLLPPAAEQLPRGQARGPAPTGSAPHPKRGKTGYVYGALGLIALIVGIGKLSSSQEPAKVTSAPSTPVGNMGMNVFGFASSFPTGGQTSAGQTQKPAPTASTASYKDGTYTAEGDYFTHVGPEAIQVTVTLKGNVVTDSSVQEMPNDRMSQRYMDLFVQNYKPYVVGLPIDSVQFTGPVSGSSLTPQGFDDALQKIKAQART